MFFDRRCPGCRRHSPRRRGDRVICERCCGELLGRRLKTVPTGSGRRQLRSLSVLFGYDRLVAGLVLAAKNGGRRDLLELFGRWLAMQFQETAGPAGTVPVLDAVTWVPASTIHRRRRGYDQGELLAAAAAAELAVPARRLLGRRGGQTQAGLGRSQRLVGPALRGVGKAPVRVLLVDDVMTTGASLANAAGVLRAGGSLLIHGAVVAVAPGHEPGPKVPSGSDGGLVASGQSVGASNRARA